MYTSAPHIIYTRDGSSQRLTLDQAYDLEDLLALSPRDNNLPYGWRMSLGRRGVRVPVRHEQQVLRKIRQLRAQGLGKRRIAKRLDALGIRPRKGGTKWEPRSVQSILDRLERGRDRSAVAEYRSDCESCSAGTP